MTVQWKSSGRCTDAGNNTTVGQAWTSLDKVSGTLEEIYFLAPKCKVNHLQLWLYRSDLPEITPSIQLDRFGRVLMDASPTRLTASIHSAAFDHNVATGLFAVPGMTRLDLDVESVGFITLGPVMDNIRQALRGTGVEHFHLRLVDVDIIGHGDVLPDAEAYALDSRAEGFARSLAKNELSLQNINILYRSNQIESGTRRFSWDVIRDYHSGAVQLEVSH